MGDFWFQRTRGRVAAVVLTLYLIAVGLLLIAQLESTWGQRDQRATVVRVELTGGTRDCGRSCTCLEARVTMSLDDGGAGSLLQCEERYSPGDELEVRRKRSSWQEIEPAPPGVRQAVVAAAVAPPLILAGAWLRLRVHRRQ